MNQTYIKRAGLTLSSVLLMILLAVPTIFAAGYDWTERTASGERVWQDITSSADGTKLAATVNNGYIYTSTDSGATWTEQTASGVRSWREIASSADGTKLVAVAGNGGHVYTSTDSGATWTERSVTWGKAAASSADGTKLVVPVYGGNIFTSTDSGATWTERVVPDATLWYSVASSADGTKLAAVTTLQNGAVFTSTDSGATWTEQTDAGVREWRGIASSADGNKLVAVATGDGVYTSTDAGATWTEQTDAGTGFWNAAASSANGMVLAVASSSQPIKTSTDGGVTWTSETGSTSRSWIGLTLSDDGSKIAGAASGKHIMTSYNPDLQEEAPPEENEDEGEDGDGEDLDIDGVPDEIENAAPNGGDANNDGIQDSEQAHVTSLPTSAGSYAAVVVDEDCDLEEVIAEAEAAKATQDGGYSYPTGFIGFGASCGDPGYTTEVTLYFYDVEDDYAVRKYNPNTQVYFTIASATKAVQTIGGQAVTIVTYQVSDGGELDMDGVVNGTIIDPVGLGALGVSAPNTGIGSVRDFLFRSAR